MIGPTGAETAADPRATAFGAHPGRPVRIRPGMAPRERWLVAVALGGQGRYAAAATILTRLHVDADVPRAVAAHAAVTRASHLRQQGGHALARRSDALGLRLATGAGVGGDPDDDGTDAAAARIDALVGLAADAVGLGMPTATARLLDAAGREARTHPSWRPAVRLGWVRAEAALVAGRPEEACEAAADALERARAAGSARHVCKSRLVLAVAAGVAGSGGGTVAELDAIDAECARLGLLPLRWPCALAAADLLGRAVGDGPSDNDHVARSAERAPNGRADGAARRRHAATLTTNVITQQTDPIGKRLLGVSM